ncbi:MAG: ornithine carbamoyltransferase [Halobacteria archaeon]|nr:ornithine carbamoyltransferase [Halobacteria archaeon]
MPGLKGRDYLRIDDLSAEEIRGLLDETAETKREPVTDELENRNLGMVFQKRSTRTRVSFEVGMNQLGGDAVFLSSDDLQLGRGETVADTSRALSRYVDALMARVYDHSDVVELAEHSDVPVVNGLSDFNHPCQALSDLFTVSEAKGSLEGVSLAWLGDGNNVCHSLLHGSSLVGMNVRVATPEEHEPDADVVGRAREYAEESGSTVMTTNDPLEAVEGADVVYTDSWISMGDDDKEEEVFEEFRVDSELTSHAADDYLFMHCLPAHRGKEVTDEVIDGENSVVWEQAENRMHTQKALLKRLVA